jgi:hypothetical protein
MMVVGAFHVLAGVGVILWARKHDDGTPAIGSDL